MKQELAEWLFKTESLKICPENKPFWYTSGRLGPYYINTQFLYGSEQEANALLGTINKAVSDKMRCPGLLSDIIRKQYNGNPIFKGTIDTLAAYINENISVNEIEYISGGERRDWFFSLMTAELLNKPHITIYKDMDIVLTENGATVKAEELNNISVLHIADLITAASSYERAWVPAVKGINGAIKWSLVVVDRLQGGKEVLNGLGVESHALISIDKNMFGLALERGYINKVQYEMVCDYYDDPEKSMKDFLENNSSFLTEALNSDEKTAKRAQLCLDNNFYDIC